MNLSEFLKDTLCKMGIQEAAGVSVKFKDGSVINIHSDDHPVLRQTAENVESVTPRQSAEGG